MCAFEEGMDLYRFTATKLLEHFGKTEHTADDVSAVADIIQKNLLPKLQLDMHSKRLVELREEIEKEESLILGLTQQVPICINNKLCRNIGK